MNRRMLVPWANPWLDDREQNEVDKLFKSKWLSMGPKTAEFEDTMKRYIGVKHAVAVSNGTDALDLALKVLGIGPGDEVIVPAMTYIATASAVLYQHATPFFADIERDTYNIDPASVKKRISKKTKCIIYIDYGGNPADHDGMRSISKRYGIPLLHDGAQSLGAELNGESLCRQGLVSTTSFHIAKLMTTVEGGMIFTDDGKIASKLKMMRNQGEDPKRKYIHKVLGTNSRMTDIQAAIGIRQMGKFRSILRRRRAVWDFYCESFSQSECITLPHVRRGVKPAWFFAPILIEKRDAVARTLERAGISTRIAYPMPVYEQPLFAIYRDKKQKYDCPNAKWMTERVLNLPIFYSITKKELQHVATNVLKAVNAYER